MKFSTLVLIIAEAVKNYWSLQSKETLSYFYHYRIKEFVSMLIRLDLV